MSLKCETDGEVGNHTGKNTGIIQKFKQMKIQQNTGNIFKKTADKNASFNNEKSNYFGVISGKPLTQKK